MKTIADYQPSGTVRAVIAYAAAWARENFTPLDAVARGAACAAVDAELRSQDIWVTLAESDAWCDAAIAEAVTKRAAKAA